MHQQSAADTARALAQSHPEPVHACRVDQLEGEAAGLRQELQALRGELSRARSDSVQLVEKIRYLQSYQAKQAGVSSNSAYQIVQVDSDGIPQSKARLCFS